MSKLIERFDINDTLYIYLQDNSKRWYSRFVLFGKWYSKATKQKDKDKAIAMAHRLFLEHEIGIKTNTLVQSKAFCFVAEKCIESMERELEYGGGKLTYKDYICALRKYHIPYFDRTYVTSIDQAKITQFDQWRIEQFKRIPARSTLQTHNSALQMVFKEAIERKWMIPVQVPILKSDGTAGQRRAAFSPEEYDKVFCGVLASIDNSHTKKTRQIRELLQDYIEFAVYTGIRPGTEMENITWGDIAIKRQNEKVVFYVHVRKGKTTKYTGTREVVCRKDIFSCLDELRDRFPHRKPSDKLFRLADGTTTNQLGKAFEKVLSNMGLKDSPHGPRTLYSLRHSYITWQLLKGDVSMEVVAKQCGTSVAMIEQHYSHVVPKMFTNELSGVELKQDKLVKKRHKLLPKAIIKRTEKMKSWEIEYKTRGCI